MKILKSLLVPAVAALVLSAGAAYAQTTPAPATPAPAMKAKPAKPAMSADQKAAISKACSAAADKQGLHGKDRKKFRESCKSHGGPA
ncbi:phosphate starvation-inducible protein PsiF [Labrys okinawensis]|uniref:phosphate starvation-inducible protein PsiF n=1 Tax=Labrys okinawensis TaxID=346911 RepID=UPI0039BC74BA